MHRRHRPAFVAISLAVALSVARAGEPARLFSTVTTKQELAARKNQILALVDAGFAGETASSAVPSHPAPAMNRQKFVRVTDRPVRILSQNPFLCRADPSGPHAGYWIDVLVTEDGVATMREGKGPYPLGTIILKQKFADAQRKKTDLFTGMLKREKGYNPKVGDWEFFELNSNRTQVTHLGRIDSCMGCHTWFKSHDFVSGDYLARIGDRPSRGAANRTP